MERDWEDLTVTQRDRVVNRLVELAEEARFKGQGRLLSGELLMADQLFADAQAFMAATKKLPVVIEVE